MSSFPPLRASKPISITGCPHLSDRCPPTVLPSLHRRGNTLTHGSLCLVQSRHRETYFKQGRRWEYSYFLQHDHQGEKKKSTSIYPPICSRMEDKLFQFYRNECFMSCLCFPESVLNSYILLNAWMFSTEIVL